MIIGIDLGTTNSLVAYYSKEGAKIIPNRMGDNLTPSVVSIDDNDIVYVGESAKERLMIYNKSTFDLIKKYMGTKKEFVAFDKVYSAEELSSVILRSLKEDAEKYLKAEVKEAVISVPAYFNDAQRKATKRAGELAGLKVERIISEPTAAAISYGLHKKDANTKFLVFDLGGGTFDVSILELYKNIMEVRAVAGDNNLGGEDFTNVLVKMFLTKFELSEDELDEKQLLLIKKQAEKAKIDFGNSDTSCKSIMKCNISDKEYIYEISEKEYEDACQILLSKIRKPIEKSLKDAKVRLADIDEIILVGGATRLFVVRKFVGKLFGRIPNTKLNPDEVVAKGCAIQAAMKERNEDIKEIVLTDVCPFTLGTEIVVERGDDFMEKGHFFPIIKRNTVIPVSRTEKLYTAYDNQNKMKIRILQGESRFSKNNIYLGELSVLVPPKKAGEESIDVTYTYDINSILEVEVKVNSTKEKKKVIIQKEDSGLSSKDIEKRFKELSYLKIIPRELEENKVLLFKGESLYEESVGSVRKMIESKLRKFEAILDKQDKSSIEVARLEFKDFLDGIEKDGASVF